MTANLRAAAAAVALLIAILGGGTAFAQKPGGILKMYSLDSPPSMSMLDGPNPIGSASVLARPYLSSQTSSKHQPLKGLLAMMVNPFTPGCQQVGSRA
jgi:hypothetical protein